MTVIFAIISVVTLASAVAAVSLRNLVYCALCLTVTFAGLAAFYLQLGVPFAGWAQILVYVGAVAVLVVFAILLTRSGDPVAQPILPGSRSTGLAVAVVIFGLLLAGIHTSRMARRLPSRKPEPSVRSIGTQLMTRYVLPLEAIAMLLTAATIGAALIAMRETGPKRSDGREPASSKTDHAPDHAGGEHTK